MNKKPSKPKPLELTVKLKRRAWMTIRDDGYNIYIVVNNTPTKAQAAGGDDQMLLAAFQTQRPRS